MPSFVIIFLVVRKGDIVLNEHVLIGLTGIIVFGIGAQWLAWRLRLPTILLLLVVGFLVGPIFGFLHPDELFGDLLFTIVSLSVAVILFEGGLSLKFSELRQAGVVIRNLVTVGALITWLLSANIAYIILDFDFELSLLLGAILVVTGPTVVLPLLRHVRPVGRVSSILKWEGIVIDPVGAILAVLVFEAILAEDQFGVVTSVILIGVLKTIVIGLILGGLGAALVVVLLRRYWVPDSMQNPVTLMVVVAVFAASNLLQEESGLLTVTLMGILVANQKQVSIRHIIEFKENLRVLLISSLFILLAARLQLADLLQINGGTIVFLAMLIFIVRPASVWLSTLGADLNWRERLFVSWMAPRGIVAAAVSSIFGLELIEVGHPNADQLVPIIFMVIIGTVLIYGLTASWAARRLDLAQENPQGLLLAGANDLSRAIARSLQEKEFRTLLVDTNWHNISEARLEGLPTYYGNIFSESILDEINLAGIGRLLALTPNDEANSLAVLHFIEVFGRAEVYQLVPQADYYKGNRGLRSQDLRGRLLFGPQITCQVLNERFHRGATIKTTNLTQEFNYQTFQEMYGETAIPLFMINKNGRLIIRTVDEPLQPQPGHKLISLIGPEDARLEPIEDAPDGEAEESDWLGF